MCSNNTAFYSASVYVVMEEPIGRENKNKKRKKGSHLLFVVFFFRLINSLNPFEFILGNLNLVIITTTTTTTNGTRLSASATNNID